MPAGAGDVRIHSSAGGKRRRPRADTSAGDVTRLASLLEDYSSSDEAALDDLFNTYKCRHVYLDVGSNVGVQVRKLYEPSKYPKALATHKVYRRFFGSEEPEARCGVCAIGVEPNPHHRARLTTVQNQLRAAGAGVLFLFAAASDADGVVRLALQSEAKKDPWEDLGASASEAWKGLSKAGNAKSVAVPVRAIDLSRLVHAVHQRLAKADSASRAASDANGQPASARARRSTSKMMMKLDVEGLEFAIAPALVRAQALCLIDGIRIEWHTRFWSARVAAAAAEARNLSRPHEVGAKLVTSTTEAIRSQVRAMLPSADCRTQLLEADDESYMHDRKPFPEARICNRTS